MEDIVLAEELLENVEGMLLQLEEVVSEDFSLLGELLYQAKEELEEFLQNA